MDQIGKEEFDKIDTSKPLPVRDLTPEQREKRVEELIGDLAEPVELQKRVAAELRFDLDHMIEEDLREHGHLTDRTRKWIVEYNEVLDKIHKNLHGQKSVQFTVGMKVSHAHIATLMRKYADSGKPRNVTPEKIG